MPSFEYEDKYSGLIAGVDEVGVGPWAGPVVAAAVILDRNSFPKDINDSKKLSPQKREDLYNILINSCDYAIGVVEEAIIDEINILNAAKLAMQKAVFSLIKKPNILLVDGNGKMKIEGMTIESIIKGDSKSYSIAAASIIAKVTRDKIMADLHNEFPYYGWHTNSGYGTKAHQDGLKNHGICKYHRKSYAPIKVYING